MKTVAVSAVSLAALRSNEIVEITETLDTGVRLVARVRVLSLKGIPLHIDTAAAEAAETPPAAEAATDEPAPEPAELDPTP